jgi:hypothetical protein
LYWHLGIDYSETVPERVLEVLRAHYHDNNLRNLRLTGELLKITRAFEVEGIPVIPFKGSTLAVLAYGSLGLREFADLDILVHEQDVSRARKSLASMGYRRQDRVTGAREAAFLKTRREYVFAREGGAVVELHWALTPRILAFRLKPEDLWDRVEKFTLGRDSVSTLSTEDTLLFLCVHGSKHFWHRLAWICDVAELLRAREAIDWYQLTERAGQQGAQRTLFLGLTLASELLGATLPPTISEKIRADRAVQPLSRQVQEWLFQEPGETSDVFAKGLAEESGFHPFRVRVRERLRDKVLYCARAALTPTPEDWELLPLPQPFFPLYYVLRPIRLSGRYGQRLLGRLK